MPADRRCERGAVALTALVATGVLFFAFALLVQIVVWQYGRGVVQAAANDAARQAAAFEGGVGACPARFDAVRRSALGGSLGDGVGRASCTDRGEFVELSAPVRFQRWLPFSPDWEFEVRAVAAKERLPE